MPLALPAFYPQRLSQIGVSDLDRHIVPLRFHFTSDTSGSQFASRTARSGLMAITKRGRSDCGILCFDQSTRTHLGKKRANDLSAEIGLDLFAPGDHSADRLRPVLFDARVRSILRAIDFSPVHQIFLNGTQIRVLSEMTYTNNCAGQVVLYRELLLAAFASSRPPLQKSEGTGHSLNHSRVAGNDSHNHPSGDPSPRAANIQRTRQLLKAAAAVDIPLLDHVIIGRRGTDPLGRGYHSFRGAGFLDVL